MLDKSVIGLINSDLDGMASAEERDRLRQIFAENPEARKYAEQLRALSRGLAEIDRAVAPPTLRPAIMRSLLEPSTASRRESRGPARGFSLRMPLGLKPVLVFAAGLAAGLVLFAVGTRVMAPGGMDEKDLVGSLAIHGAAFSVGKPVEFSSGDMHAFVQTGIGINQAIVRVRLDIPPGTLVVLAYVERGGHVETVDVGKADRAQISLEQGRVVVQGVSSGEVGILFSGNPEVLSGARLLLSDGYGGEWSIPLEGAVAR
jgi:hypothetical protein